MSIGQEATNAACFFLNNASNSTNFQRCIVKSPSVLSAQAANYLLVVFSLIEKFL